MSFKVCQYIFTISLLSPPGEGHRPSLQKTWFPIIQGCFVPSFAEIGPVILEKKIFKVRQYIFAISLLSPLGKGWGPSFELTWNPFTKAGYVPSLVEIGPVILENKIFLSSSMFFLLFCYYLPLEMGVAIIWTNLNTITQGCFVSSLIEIGPVVLKKIL